MMITATEEPDEQLKQFMDAVRKQDRTPESHLIAILHKAQELYGYLDTSGDG